MIFEMYSLEVRKWCRIGIIYTMYETDHNSDIYVTEYLKIWVLVLIWKVKKTKHSLNH